MVLFYCNIGLRMYYDFFILMTFGGIVGLSFGMYTGFVIMTKSWRTWRQADNVRRRKQEETTALTEFR